MDAGYRPSSPFTRAGLAAAAALVSLLVIGATPGLADHYGADIQFASTAHTAVALR